MSKEAIYEYILLIKYMKQVVFAYIVPIYFDSVQHNMDVSPERHNEAKSSFS